MELDLLRAIQGLHTEMLDRIMIFLSMIAEHGEVWILIAVILICFKKTRRCGVTMGLALLIMLISGNLMLKNIFARSRPFNVDQTVHMLIEKPMSYSFPSGHTFSSFAEAFTIWRYNKTAGAAALVLASGIAFSRMYLFVHYPTDILGGILCGYVVAMLSYALVNRCAYKKIES